jgi:hypothetical protein
MGGLEKASNSQSQIVRDGILGWRAAAARHPRVILVNAFSVNVSDATWCLAGVKLTVVSGSGPSVRRSLSAAL